MSSTLVNSRQVPKGSLIIDVLSDHSYDLEHIKGAKNICVYEMAFNEKIKKEIADKNSEIFVYGLSNSTYEAKRAEYLLKKLGYNNIKIIDGGITSWKKAKLPITSVGSKSKLDGTYAISVKDSIVEWTGRNIGNKHTGNIIIKTGTLEFDDGCLKSGKIVVDMNGIKNTDMKGKYSKMLETHLKSDDFFDVKRHKEAKLEFTDIKVTNGIGSMPNFIVTAYLTIKEIKKRIEFDAHIHKKENSAVINAHLDIDRSDWDIRYGSEKFFSRLGIHIIDDIISLDLILVGKKSKSM